MLKPTLDPRLSLAADFFPYCDVGADIGADHGHLSCALLSSGKCRRMQVTDISRVSLDKAGRLMAMHGLDDRVELRLGDGLNALSSPVEAAAICGMGGHTMCRILRSGKDCLHGARLVLSPQTDQPEVRRVLYEELGYHLEREAAVFAAGRFYLVMLAVPGAEPITEKALYLSPCLMKAEDDVYRRYIAWRRDVVACEQGANATRRRLWLNEEWERVKQ